LIVKDRPLLGAACVTPFTSIPLTAQLLDSPHPLFRRVRYREHRPVTRPGIRRSFKRRADWPLALSNRSRRWRVLRSPIPRIPIPASLAINPGRVDLVAVRVAPTSPESQVGETARRAV